MKTGTAAPVRRLAASDRIVQGTLWTAVSYAFCRAQLSVIFIAPALITLLTAGDFLLGLADGESTDARGRERSNRHKKSRQPKKHLDERRRSRKEKRAKEKRVSISNASVEIPSGDVDIDAVDRRPRSSSAIVVKRSEYAKLLRSSSRYFIDTHADPANIAYGSLYNKDIPFYRREKLSSGLLADRKSRGSTPAANAPQRFFARSARRLSRSVPPPRRNHSALVTTDEKDFIPIGDKDSDDSDVEASENRARERIRALNEAIGKTPLDPSTWLALVQYQGITAHSRLWATPALSGYCERLNGGPRWTCDCRRARISGSPGGARGGGEKSVNSGESYGHISPRI